MERICTVPKQIYLYQGFSKGVTDRQKHTLLLPKQFTTSTRSGKTISVPQHFGLFHQKSSNQAFCLQWDFSSASGRNSHNFKHLQAFIYLFIRDDLQCTPLAMLACKLCISYIKSSFRSEQSQFSKAIIGTVLLQTSLSSSTLLLYLLACKLFCPERFNLFPTPFQLQFVFAVFSCKDLNTLVHVDRG